MKRSSSETGRLGEELVAFYLKRSGYSILRRNYRIRGGEIDIIAASEEVIAFVEVKTRHEGSMTSGFEAVGARKQRLIIRTALKFLSEFPSDLQPRFDVAEVTVRDGRVRKLKYLDSAFDMEGFYLDE